MPSRKRLATIPWFLILASIPAVLAESPPEPRVTRIDPPESGFFSKQVVYKGIPIKAHKDVADAALLEAYRRLDRMLGRQPVVVENLVDAGAELQVIGKDQATSDLPSLRYLKGRPFDRRGKRTITVDERARGLGGIPSSCGEENLLRLPSDRYLGRDICLHEFAHAVLGYGLSPDARDAVHKQFLASTRKGLWKTAYAATNDDEYFAELVMWYFGTRGDLGKIDPPPKPGAEWLRGYDPDGYALLDALFSGRTPVKRTAREELTPRPPEDEPKLRSLSEGHPTSILFDNRTEKDYSLFWLDPDCKRKPYGKLRAHEKRAQETFAAHPWVVVDPDGKVIGVYVPGEAQAKVVLR